MKHSEQKKEELRLVTALEREAQKSAQKGLPREAVYEALKAIMTEFAVPEGGE